MTEDEFAILRANQRAAGWTQADADKLAGEVKPKARRGRMNKLEAAFQREVLDECVAWFDFEPLKFRLADSAWYTPDFLVQGEGGAFTVFEVKGHWREAARVRIKVAADKYPFTFVAVTKDRRTGEWVYERIPGRATA